MSNIRAVAHFRIHPGKVEEFKELSRQCVERARANDPDTLAYDIFFNADQSEAVVFEEYSSSEGCIAHFKNMGELAPAIFSIVDANGFTLGDPSDELRSALDENDVRLFTPFMSK